MASSWQLECLRSRIRSLEHEIKRVADKDHPYSEPDTIYRALQNVLRSRAQHFNDACELYQGKEYVRDLDTTFNEVATDVQRVFEVFGYADRVDSPRIPFEILRCLSWAANTLIGEDCKAVVRLDSAYNYTIVSCRRRFVELGWERYWSQAIIDRVSGSTASTVLVLGFPSPDAGSILLHALAAHEFAHEMLAKSAGRAIESVREKALISAKLRYREELEEYIADNMRRRDGVTQQDAAQESSKKLEAQLLRISQFWLTEVWADLVAARLVGPAALAAFDRVLLESGEPCESHPPGAFRRRLVQNYLKKEFPVIGNDETWVSVFSNPAQAISRSERPDGAESLRPLFKTCEHMCETSVEMLSSLLNDVASPLKIEGLEKIVNAMEEFIANLAPPNAALPKHVAQSPSVFWILMYGAWHFRLNNLKFESFCKRYGWNPDDGKGESALGNLLLHAIQSAELMYQWENRTPSDALTLGGSHGS